MGNRFSRLREETWQDAKFAFRMFVKSPLFAVTAILPLALAIGANTAVFSVVNAVLLRPLPVPAPSQLVNINVVDGRYGRGALSYANIHELNSLKTTFASVSGWMLPTLNAQLDNTLLRAVTLVVTPEYFRTFPVRAVVGRTFIAADSTPSGSTPVALISEQFWQAHFDRDPKVLGRSIRIEGLLFLIVGVLPTSFTSPQIDLTADVAIPIEASPLSVFEGFDHFDPKSVYLFSTSARLQEKVSLAQARSRTNALWPSILADSLPTSLDPSQAKDWLSHRLQLESGARGQSFLRDQFSDGLKLLMGALALLLLMACANIAALLIARSTARSGEISVRLALGASSSRLIRQLLVESLLLATLSTVVGTIAALWFSPMLLRLMWSYAFPLTLSTHPDVKILAFSVLIGCCATILFGLAPSWFAIHGKLNASLRGSARSLLPSGTRSAKRYLVSLEIALSVVLLASAVLLMRSAHRLRSVELGFKPEGVAELYIVPRPGGYPDSDKDPYQRKLLASVSSVPGVEAAALSEWLPVNNGVWNERLRANSASGAKSTPLQAHTQVVSPGFLTTLGISLRQGRDFSVHDAASSQKVVVISQSLARRLYSGDALGHSLLLEGHGDFNQRLQIIGIAADARLGDLHAYNPLQIYLPLFQQTKRLRYAILEIRTNESPMTFVPKVSQAIGQLGHEYVWRAENLSEAIDLHLSQERILVALATFFGIVALGLSLIGLYGLLAYMVQHRVREFGLRMALGAKTWDILRLVWAEAVLLIGIGVTAGLPLSLLGRKVLGNRLPYLAVADTSFIEPTVVALALCGLLAAALPARRAAKIDPAEALRTE